MIAFVFASLLASPAAWAEDECPTGTRETKSGCAASVDLGVSGSCARFAALYGDVETCQYTPRGSQFRKNYAPCSIGMKAYCEDQQKSYQANPKVNRRTAQLELDKTLAKKAKSAKTSAIATTQTTMKNSRTGGNGDGTATPPALPLDLDSLCQRAGAICSPTDSQPLNQQSVDNMEQILNRFNVDPVAREKAINDFEKSGASLLPQLKARVYSAAVRRGLDNLLTLEKQAGGNGAATQAAIAVACPANGTLPRACAGLSQKQAIQAYLTDIYPQNIPEICQSPPSFQTDAPALDPDAATRRLQSLNASVREMNSQLEQLQSLISGYFARKGASEKTKGATGWINGKASQLAEGTEYWDAGKVVATMESDNDEAKDAIRNAFDAYKVAYARFLMSPGAFLYLDGSKYGTKYLFGGRTLVSTPGKLFSLAYPTEDFRYPEIAATDIYSAADQLKSAFEKSACDWLGDLAGRDTQAAEDDPLLASGCLGSNGETGGVGAWSNPALGYTMGGRGGFLHLLLTNPTETAALLQQPGLSPEAIAYVCALKQRLLGCLGADDPRIKALFNAGVEGAMFGLGPVGIAAAAIKKSYEMGKTNRDAGLTAQYRQLLGNGWFGGSDGTLDAEWLTRFLGSSETMAREQQQKVRGMTREQLVFIANVGGAAAFSRIMMTKTGQAFLADETSGLFSGGLQTSQRTLSTASRTALSFSDDVPALTTSEATNTASTTSKAANTVSITGSKTVRSLVPRPTNQLIKQLDEEFPVQVLYTKDGRVPTKQELNAYFKNNPDSIYVGVSRSPNMPIVKRLLSGQKTNDAHVYTVVADGKGGWIRFDGAIAYSKFKPTDNPFSSGMIAKIDNVPPDGMAKLRNVMAEGKPRFFQLGCASPHFSPAVVPK